MKILVVSNFYPPHHIGGYEMGCKEIVDRLRQRGHEIRVLTSTHGVHKATVEGHVHRELTAKLHWPSGIRLLFTFLGKELHNQRRLRKQIQDFQPEVIYLWSLTFGIYSLMEVAIQSGIPVTCFVSDQWLSSGTRADPLLNVLNSSSTKWSSRIARRFLRIGLWIGGCTVPQAMPRLTQVQFCSRYLAKLTAGAIPANTSVEVIHWGVDAERFPQTPKRFPPKRLLYVGRLDRSKGVHTALDAFLKLAEQKGYEDLRFRIIGAAALDPAYETALRATAADSPAGDRVTFTGSLPSDQVVAAYQTHDILIFPSEWEEPFSIALLEAMASGLAVVGTLTGGTGEILVAYETGLTFRTSDATDLKSQIEILLGDFSLYERIKLNAAKIVQELHSITQMVDHIESALTEITFRHAKQKTGTFDAGVI